MSKEFTHIVNAGDRWLEENSVRNHIAKLERELREARIIIRGAEVGSVLRTHFDAYHSRELWAKRKTIWLKRNALEVKE